MLRGQLLKSSGRLTLRHCYFPTWDSAILPGLRSALASRMTWAHHPFASPSLCSIPFLSGGWTVFCCPSLNFGETVTSGRKTLVDEDR